ncbi:MAG: VTT domain-containing protein [candidate division KSB1 bacterium]|nr:VTT domain-containing protein [candidate division KSB1 bacterium]MDZ7364922.1 VTT domain-containing protein [candidate division KSB1 bacterium]MDZ7403023.1 VTT domain-containing protein [candidate division KSB1 bacterium]
MTHLLDNFGLPGLMVFCFFAATVLPVSSEAALVAALALKMPALPALAFATIGNCSGIAFNYWMGSQVEEKLLHQHLQKQSLARAYGMMQRWGQWSLLLSWLPVIGDPITYLAGALRLNFYLFILVASTLRFLRYLAVAGFF